MDADLQLKLIAPAVVPFFQFDHKVTLGHYIVHYIQLRTLYQLKYLGIHSKIQ